MQSFQPNTWVCCRRTHRNKWALLLLLSQNRSLIPHRRRGQQFQAAGFSAIAGKLKSKFKVPGSMGLAHMRVALSSGTHRVGAKLRNLKRRHKTSSTDSTTDA